jgi:hypothetical protein
LKRSPGSDDVYPVLRSKPGWALAAVVIRVAAGCGGGPDGGFADAGPVGGESGSVQADGSLEGGVEAPVEPPDGDGGPAPGGEIWDAEAIDGPASSRPTAQS